MKILHIEAGRYLYGGAQQVVWLTRGLALRGVQNVLVCPNGSEIAGAAADTVRVRMVTMKGDLDLRLVSRLTKVIREEKPDLLSKEQFNLMHKNIAKKLLSTNNEKWNTIPRTYAEIDTLRAKFEKENHQDKLVILDEINAYVEELEKIYSKV